MSIETGVHYPLNLNDLPDGWRAAYFGEFTERIEPGFASGEHNQTGSGIPHLRPMNIDRGGRIDLSVVKSVDAGKDKRRLAVDDVLFNNTNSTELVGKTAVISQSGEFAFSNHMTRVQLKESVLPKYAALQFHLLWMRGYFKYNCVKHVNQASISSRTLAQSVPFIWAPLAQQETIVAELEKQFSRLDEAVANLQRVKANLKRYKASILKAAVEGRLVETLGDEAESHDSSKWIPIGRVIQSLDQGWSPQCENEPRPDDRQWAVMKTTAVQPMQFLEAENKRLPLGLTPREHLELVDGDLLITRAGPRTRVGITCLVRASAHRLMLCDKAYRLRAKLDSTLPAYLEIVLNSPTLLDSLDEMKSGISDSGLNLTQKRFAALRIPLPSLTVQTRIVAEVDRHLSIIREVEAEVDANLQRAQALRQAVLSKAFAA